MGRRRAATAVLWRINALLARAQPAQEDEVSLDLERDSGSVRGAGSKQAAGEQDDGGDLQDDR